MITVTKQVAAPSLDKVRAWLKSKKWTLAATTHPWEFWTPPPEEYKGKWNLAKLPIEPSYVDFEDCMNDALLRLGLLFDYPDTFSIWQEIVDTVVLPANCGVCPHFEPDPVDGSYCHLASGAKVDSAQEPPVFCPLKAS